jgi:ATP-dependent DNA ligase
VPTNATGLAVEWKWDGWRCLARRAADGQVRLDSRAGKSLAESFPEIVAAMAEDAPGRRLALDGDSSYSARPAYPTSSGSSVD